MLQVSGDKIYYSRKCANLSALLIKENVGDFM
jgi:hypothetical protein